MTAEYGAATQLEKIDMLDFADVIAINKFDHRGCARRRCATCASSTAATTTCSRRRTRTLPVFGTIATQFNDPGMNRLYAR